MKDHSHTEVLNPLSLADILHSSTSHLQRLAGQSRLTDHWARSAGDRHNHFRDVLEVVNTRTHGLRRSLDDLGVRRKETLRAAQEFFREPQPTDWPNYLIDVAQRWVLFTDVLRRRGNNFVHQEREGSQPVLIYDYDVIIDGTTLERPVNYSLVAIKPPRGVRVDPKKRPYIIIDPRAGQGSGIGGFKHESEVGVALQAGHPVYFCIFSKLPTPTQTLADVTRAEAEFVRHVRNRHPESAKPVIIGNCQGGWAAMLLGATNLDLTGPIVINGAPLSYWRGVRGKNPMRYLGGLLGGALPALMLADQGNGKFDGANLIWNFECLNPATTWWRKNYDLFAKIDTDAEDFLQFERWWSGFYFMNEAEIRWIVENLFVGNRLGRGNAQLDSRMHVDLRFIKAPIIVFASHGDYITPPVQALGWIADLYSDVKEIKARGQKIIYTIHDDIGHLGIFVSASVANKQHKEIVSTLATIEAMQPGLYEMVIEDETGTGLEKRYSISFQERSIDDIRALDETGGDDAPFAAISRLSRIGAEAYNLTARPVVRALSNDFTARLHNATNPLRAQRYWVSDLNPALAPVESLAKVVRERRVEAPCDNPFYRLERQNAYLISDWINLFRDVRDGFIETWFTTVFSSPWMRALARDETPRISDVAGTDLRSVGEVIQALEQVKRGGLAVAVIRMLILLAHARKSVRRDRLERSDELLSTREPYVTLGAATLNRIIHQQSLIVAFETDDALGTLPDLLPTAEERETAVEHCRFVLGPEGDMNADTADMFARLREVLGVR